MSNTDNMSAVVQLMKEFEATADSSYCLFLSDKIKATSHPETIIGIRMGVIRKYARIFSQHLSLEDAIKLLYPKAVQWYEYKLLFGLVLEKIVPPEKVTIVLPLFYNLCDGWAVPDLYQTILGQFAKRGSLDEVLASIEAYTASPNPFARRLTIVTQMPLTKLGLVPVETALSQCERLQWDEEYLVQMGVAWTLSELYINYTSTVQDFIDQGDISSEEVLKKYRQKLRDSLRLKN